MSGTIEHRGLNLKHAQIGDFRFSDTPAQSIAFPETKLVANDVGKTLKIVAVTDRLVKTEWAESGLTGDSAPTLLTDMTANGNEIKDVKLVQLRA